MPETPPQPPSVVIDVTDPLLLHFTIQHDLRERFKHALDTALEVIDSTDGDDPVDVLAAVRTIIVDALDPHSIHEWIEAGRPLPWIDAYLGESVEQLTESVLKMLRSKDVGPG